MDMTSFLLGYKSGQNAGGGSSGGGTVEGVHFVTFMSEDGTTELYKRPVADGDNCADPVDRELIEAPTKESTAQYDYSFVGWATTPNGAWNESALDAVTEDRTVYAAYASAVRYYTITYLDSDGVTVLKTESLAYGSTPVGYTPEKDGYSFAGWIPDFATVTGNVRYTASWIEAVTFAGSSWAKIAEIAESGNAADYFALGDERTIPVTIDGTVYSFKAKIVGFNHDEISDGTTAGISVMFFTVPNEKQQWRATAPSSSVAFSATPLYTYASNFYQNLPEELQAVIKMKKQKWNATNTTTASFSAMRTWIPSSKEISKNAYSTVEVGTLYPYFETYNYGMLYGTNDTYKRGAYTAAGTLINNASFWNCDGSQISGNFNPYSWNLSGTISRTTATQTHYVAIGFCI